MKNDEHETIELAGKNITFTIKKNKRIKYYRLSYRHEQGLIVQVPRSFSQQEIENILSRHRRWILNRINHTKSVQVKNPPFKIQHGSKLPVHGDFYKLSLNISPNEKMYWQLKEKVLEICLTEENRNWITQIIIQWYKDMASEFLQKRLLFWSNKMEIKYNQIRVKNQGSLWGSCSGKKNLNFNWRIMLLTPEVADYLIVHELAHLIQLNHSSKFWKVVETYLPNYKVLKQNIKENNYLLNFP